MSLHANGRVLVCFCITEGATKGMILYNKLQDSLPAFMLSHMSKVADNTWRHICSLMPKVH